MTKKEKKELTNTYYQVLVYMQFLAEKMATINDDIFIRNFSIEVKKHKEYIKPLNYKNYEI